MTEKSTRAKSRASARQPKKPALPPISAADFAEIYAGFKASIARYDCGKHCAPLNGGEPVCCSTQHAIPIVHKTEWDLLKSRSQLWHPFKAYDKETRDIVKDMHQDCAAIECKGPRFCERDNRSMACRAFPFFPYHDREGKFIGLAYYWDYEERCWVISNMQIVEREFLDQFVRAFEKLMALDPEEYDNFKSHSATMRRVFTRRNKPILMIGREGGFYAIRPRGRGMIKIAPAKLPKFGPYRSAKAYAKALKLAQTPPIFPALGPGQVGGKPADAQHPSHDAKHGVDPIRV